MSGHFEVRIELIHIHSPLAFDDGYLRSDVDGPINHASDKRGPNQDICVSRLISVK